jgi:hypothetical protein
MKTTFKLTLASVVLVGLVTAAPPARAAIFTDTSVGQYWYSFQGEYGVGTYLGGNYVTPTVSGGYLSTPLPANEAPSGSSVSTRQNWTFVYDDGTPAVESLYGGSLIGDLSSKTAVTATFRLNLSTPAGSTLDPSQLWYSTPGSLPTVRFLFEAYDPALYGGTGVTPDLHWWSNPGAIGLTTMANGEDYTLTVNLDPSLWSDDYGVNGAADGGVAFRQTLASTLDFGISFGGGSGFENGFALMPGVSGSFDLKEMETLAVPEPTTMIAGALLLLPFGASTLRMLRKNRPA